MPVGECLRLEFKQASEEEGDLELLLARFVQSSSKIPLDILKCVLRMRAAPFAPSALLLAGMPIDEICRPHQPKLCRGRSNRAASVKAAFSSLRSYSASLSPMPPRKKACSFKTSFRSDQSRTVRQMRVRLCRSPSIPKFLTAATRRINPLTGEHRLRSFAGVTIGAGPFGYDVRHRRWRPLSPIGQTSPGGIKRAAVSTASALLVH